MKVSVVGCGNISKCHFKALTQIEGIEISSVVDIKHERADAAAEKYNCRAYYDFDEMLREDRPDCIHICTPHYLHIPMAVKALNEGVNVLCEKPAAVSKDGLDKLRMAQLMSGAQYGVCFQNRYNKSVKIVKDLLDSGIYGQLLTARAAVHWNREIEYYSDDWHGTLNKECGGVLVNQAVHTGDLLRYIAGQNVKAVTGHIFKDKFKGQIEVEDTALARYEFEDGTVALYNGTVACGLNLPVLLDFVCEKATLRIEGDNAYRITDGKIEQLSMPDNADFVGKNYWGKGHDSLITDFYDCLKTGRKFPIDAYEGGKAVEEFLAIYASDEIGEKVYLKKD